MVKEVCGFSLCESLPGERGLPPVGLYDHHKA